ncbi:hypothetical protein PENTCL1PPCAC_22657 [Pristionchus entomophagus]|uniref:Uncharacterized protein n=1 Tax=Pristionchus entomophagus TaxID=358040 RepID=A0AAV5U1N6_9BILA|nr:hypothetical protein PENTCL1PPCAC_22657 [Pristionchus entomophagus]
MSPDERSHTLSNSSRSTQPGFPAFFAPQVHSSPQKGTISSKARYMHSNGTLLLSPPLSRGGSYASSSRSLEEDLTAELSQIKVGLEGLRREAVAAYKVTSWECRDGSLDMIIDEYTGLVKRLPREKKRQPPFHVEDSNFQIYSSSSGSSSERLLSGSGIEKARANTVSRGTESNELISLIQRSPPRRLMREENRGEGRNGRRTEGTQTEYEERKGDMESRRMMIDRQEEEEEERRKARRKKKERVRIVENQLTDSSPERERARLPSRSTRDTVRRDPQRREERYQQPLSPSLDGLRLEETLDHPFRSFTSIPSRMIFEPLQFSSAGTTRLEYPWVEERRERRESPRKEKEVKRIAIRVEKSPLDRMREEKEKRSIDFFPPVIDIDQMRGRKKCAKASKSTLSGDGVKETMRDEKEVVRRGRGRSEGMKIEKTMERKRYPSLRIRDPSQGNKLRNPAFLASGQTDGVSHSLAANRQQLLNLIKCHLPSIHLRVKQYLERERYSAREHDIISGLRNYLIDESERIQEDRESRVSGYERKDEGEKKDELHMEIQRSNALISEAKYLKEQLDCLISPSISSSIVNQLRSIHSHLIKCAPLRSEEPKNGE